MHVAYGGDATLKGKLHARLQKQGDRDSHGYHSSAYHKYFEGYTEYQTLDRSGRRKIQRVYTGSVYRQAVSPAAGVGLRAAHVALLAVQVALLVHIALLGRASDANPVMALAELATVLTLTLLAYTVLLDVVFAPMQLTIGAYRAGVVALRRRALAAAACFGLDAAVNLVVNVLLGSAAAAQDWRSAGLFAVAAAAALAMYGIARATPYTKTEGKTKMGEDDGVEILC